MNINSKKRLAMNIAALIETALKNIAVWYLHFTRMEMTSQKYQHAESRYRLFFTKTYSK